MPVLTVVFQGELALIRICHPFSVWPKFIAPYRGLTSPATACSNLPFRFGWGSLRGPRCVGKGILMSDVHYWIIFFALDVTLRTERVAPIGAVYVGPPLEMVVERNRVIRGRKDHGAGN